MKPTKTLGEFIEENYGKDFIDKIWSDKNEKDPYSYGFRSGKNAWFKCPNCLHEDEQREICNATLRGFKCRQCSIKEQHLKQLDNLVGKNFGYWTVIEKDEDGSKNMGITCWFCDCKCGTKHISVPACNLKSGASKSCGCRRFENSGENHYNWQGGITAERYQIRNSYEYKQWRNIVFSRDNYCCQCCSSKKGINAHHILNFADNPDYRLDESNGITLCEDCHDMFIEGSFHHIYGTRNNTPQQLEEYINNKRTELGIQLPFSLEEYRNGINILKPTKINDKKF